MLSLELNAQNGESNETFSIIFNSIERRLLFESKLNEIKQQLSGKEIQTPFFLREIALPKTRAGLLFCCASPTLPFKTNLINIQQNNQTNVNQRFINLDKTVNNALSIQNSILASTTGTNSPNNLATMIGANAALSNTIVSQSNSTISSYSNTCLQTTDEQDVWICNSDGYVGQVCILSLSNSDPTVTSCNGVCNSRILSIFAVPAYR